jgi:hypothetical protein
MSSAASGIHFARLEVETKEAKDPVAPLRGPDNSSFLEWTKRRPFELLKPQHRYLEIQRRAGRLGSGAQYFVMV